MSEEKGLKLNDEAQKALIKSYNNYIITNGLIVLIPLYITTIIYCKIHNIDVDATLFWHVFKSPSFFVPVLIAIFIKDILKYIFCGMSKEENVYLEEAENDNPKAEGVKNIISGKSVKQRFIFITALYGIIIFLLLFLIKRLFNVITILSLFIAYFCTAKHYSFAYIDYQHIILTKYFFLIFFIAYGTLSIIKKIFIKEEVPKEEVTNN